MRTIIFGKTVIHNIEKFPDGMKYPYGDIQELESYDLERIPRDVDECWYWYATAPYEGSGYMFMRKDNLYAIESLGHCSCYGPLERMGTIDWKDLEKIELTEGLNLEVKALIELARLEGV